MTTPNFSVISMTQQDFHSFSSLLNGHFVKRTVDMNREQFNWTQIFHIKVMENYPPGEFEFKYTLRDEPFRRCSLRRRGRVNMDNYDVPKLHTNPLPIEEKKYKDIIDLLQFLDPVYHDFYLKLQNRSFDDTVSDSEDNYDDTD
jgi:hypothetical protein